jgi:hypothetical protein
VRVSTHTCHVSQYPHQPVRTHNTHRVDQNRIYTPYMTVFLVISLPKIPYVHRIYMVLANPKHSPKLLCNFPVSRSDTYRAYTHVHTYKYTHIHKYARTHTRTHTRAHTHTYINTHAHTGCCTTSLCPAPTHKHTHKRTHTYTHTHTHTHTHM